MLLDGTETWLKFVLPKIKKENEKYYGSIFFSSPSPQASQICISYQPKSLNHNQRPQFSLGADENIPSELVRKKDCSGVSAMP